MLSSRVIEINFDPCQQFQQLKPKEINLDQFEERDDNRRNWWGLLQIAE